MKVGGIVSRDLRNNNNNNNNNNMRTGFEFIDLTIDDRDGSWFCELLNTRFIESFCNASRTCHLNKYRN